MDQNNKLGEGSVGRLLLKLSLPAIVAQLVNLLYNMVDRIFAFEGNGTLKQYEGGYTEYLEARGEVNETFLISENTSFTFLKKRVKIFSFLTLG